jgi:fatty-acyl-CoA synthase
LSRLAITWLHPLGSLDDQLFQLEDSEAQMLVVDGVTFPRSRRRTRRQGHGPEDRLHARPADYGAICCKRSRPRQRHAAASPGLTISRR